MLYALVDGKLFSKENEPIVYFYKGQRFPPKIKTEKKFAVIAS